MRLLELAALVKEAGFHVDSTLSSDYFWAGSDHKQFQRFAALVAEECAKVVGGGLNFRIAEEMRAKFPMPPEVKP